MKNAVAASSGSNLYPSGLAKYVSPVVGGPVTAKLTQATQLLGRIRGAVITGKLLPGERLVVSSLAETFEAGQTPVREALMRLASEGFVIQEDQRGFAVAPVSVAELIDLTQTRSEIESIALSWSIEHGDDAWEAGLLAATHRLLKQEKLAADGHSITPGWSDKHLAFHDALVAGCPNVVLLQLRSLLSDRAERYRHLSVKYLKAPRDDRAEHEALSAAALARDKGLAVSLARKHIETTTEILLAEIHSQQENHP
jgi:DNA-binding GntR family transcriptional regulator